MKKNTLYLIGAVAGALLLLLAVPLGHLYIGWYLSACGKLSAAYAERSNRPSDFWGRSHGPVRHGVSFPA